MGGQVRVVGDGVGLAAVVEVVPAGPAVAEYPARFAAVLSAALAQSPDTATAARSAPVAQTLISTSIGIKHEVTTREAFLERLATAIDLITG